MRLRDVGARGRASGSTQTSDTAWYLALLEWRAGNWDAAGAAAASSIALSEQFGREAVTIAAWPAAVIAAHRGRR